MITSSKRTEELKMEPQFVCNVICTYSATKSFTKGMKYEVYLIDYDYFVTSNENNQIPVLRSQYDYEKWMLCKSHASFKEMK